MKNLGVNYNVAGDVTEGNNNSEKRFMTTKELAYRYGLCPRQVQKMTHDRIFPCIKYGKKVVRYDVLACDMVFKSFEQKGCECFDEKQERQIKRSFPYRPYGAFTGNKI